MILKTNNCNQRQRIKKLEVPQCKSLFYAKISFAVSYISSLAPLIETLALIFSVTTFVYQIFL